MIRTVDPNRRRGRLYRAWCAFGATRAGRWLSRHLIWKLDPPLLRWTRGRIGLSLPVPNLLLETVGARTGKLRRHGVIYFHDGDAVVVLASLAGAPKHPAWFHNLSANPDVAANGVPMTAEIVGDDDERERLWQLAGNVFPPFAVYRRWAEDSGREIPIVKLHPRSV